MKYNLLIIPFITVLLTASCNFVFEIGLEAPSVTPTAMLILPATKTVTASPVPTLEIPTITPSPTPLPGALVFPLSSLGTDIPWLKTDSSKLPQVHTITFNLSKPPFDNVLVRKAFAASVDRDAVVKLAHRYSFDKIFPATTFLPPQILGRDLYGVVGINYDPAQAKEWLNQAGYSDTSSFPTTTLIVNSYGLADPYARYNMAKAIADMWHANLGVTVEVQALKPPTFGERISTDMPEIIWIGWVPDSGNDPDFIRIYLSNFVSNYGHFSNSEFDRLVDEAAKSHDPAARQIMYIEADRLLCETEVGIIPLYHLIKYAP